VRIATGYRLYTEDLEFESWYGKKFSFLHLIQTDSGAHPAFYPMDIEGFFPEGKAAGA
jgi:hypothetical protein